MEGSLVNWWWPFKTANDRWKEQVMATLQEVLDAVEGDKEAVEAAAQRVSDDLAALSQQVADLQAQVAQGGGVTEADLQSVKDAIDTVTGEAAAIDPDAAPEA